MGRCGHRPLHPRKQSFLLNISIISTAWGYAKSGLNSDDALAAGIAYVEAVNSVDATADLAAQAVAAAGIIHPIQHEIFAGSRIAV